MKKTLKKWEKSGLDRSEYLNIGDEIDEAMFLDIAECVSPAYSDQNFMQNGEASNALRIAEFDYKKLYYHETCIKTNDGRYYYLGDLPSLTQLQFNKSVG